MSESEKEREEARLRDAGWRQTWGDCWEDPKGNFILRRVDAIRLLNDTPKEERDEKTGVHDRA